MLKGLSRSLLKSNVSRQSVHSLTVLTGCKSLLISAWNFSCFIFPLVLPPCMYWKHPSEVLFSGLNKYTFLSLSSQGNFSSPNHLGDHLKTNSHLSIYSQGLFLLVSLKMDTELTSAKHRWG